MQLNDFDFVLPKQLIAQQPAIPRNSARLLVYERSSGSITDDHFYNLQKYLAPNTCLVLNDSKVEKCRLRIGAIEIFITETISPTIHKALVKPGRKFKLDCELELDLGTEKLLVRTTAIDQTGIRTLAFSLPIDNPQLAKFKLTPLPPYIEQNEELSEQYQTVYANPIGSKAAPTAGLHFTKDQLSDISKKHSIAKVTLHVGLGTFAPVKVHKLTDHIMHSEFFELDSVNADIISRAKHITAVGTTSARTLESLHSITAQSGNTNIFITPGYGFKHTNSLITNFHLPKSTLLMLVSAFIGDSKTLLNIYQHAIDEQYKFYSFGDAMLIL